MPPSSQFDRTHLHALVDRIPPYDLRAVEKVLRAFAAATCDGLVPNCYDENTGQAQYNTVDASLWFLQAAAAFSRAGGSETFVRDELWPAACQI